MKCAVRNALLDEFDRAVNEFSEFINDFEPAFLTQPVPGRENSVSAVLAHVVDAGYRHVGYVAKNCEGHIAERRFAIDDLRTLDDIRAGLEDVMRFARQALVNVEDAALHGQRFPGRGGGDYDGEQMLEHAICHPRRHIRQLQRLFSGEMP
jgi:hypothetical protein